MYGEEWLKYAEMIVDIGENILFFSYSLCMGFFYAKLSKPFLCGKNQKSTFAGVAYMVFMMINTLFPFDFPKGVGSLIRIAVGFAMLYGMDRTRPRQKFFISVLFYTFITISMQLDSEQSMYVNDFLFDVLPFNTTPERTILLFCVGVLESAVMFGVLLGAGVMLSLKSMDDVDEEISYRDLLFLSLPFLMVFLQIWVYGDYYDLYTKYFLLLDKVGDSTTLQELSYNSLPRILNLLLLYTFILVFIWCFFDIKRMAKEKLDAAVLEEQTKDLQHHIGRMNMMYDEIHAIRHDMNHHTEVLSSLLNEGNTKEAMDYLSSMRAFVMDTGNHITTGNPVTDIILSEKADEASKLGIRFETSFVYPSDFGLDVFDVSGILGNALSNAFLACKNCRDKTELSVSVVSFLKRNTYMIEVRNSYDGILLLDQKSKLPIRKNQDVRHGIGVSNMKKIAQKYGGDITIEQMENHVVLSVILQKQTNQEEK